MTDQELIALNREGFIPGPREKEEDFLARVQAVKFFFNSPPEEFKDMERVSEPQWDWARLHLSALYDFTPRAFLAFYSNRKLMPWQGAAAWVIPSKPGPLCALQLRLGFRKGSYLKCYSREEILCHEAVHAARSAFEEVQYEEYFAYFTSIRSWRRSWGPIIERSWEAALFLGVLVAGAVSGTLIPPLILLAGSAIRLSKRKIGLKKASVQLMKRLKDEKKVRAVLFRLTDREISRLAKGEELPGDDSLRWRLIRTAYLQNTL